ncbi:MAG: aminoglycoside phosphotransferase family protein [Alphaproteobacteria bacterium]|nr:aminoglycoside phosphotransferase family protein [Alphaproteobacteria bacterium]
MADAISNLKYHGYETYAVHYGDGFVIKRPLPNKSEAERKKWLEKQHKTQQIINDIRAVGNPFYNVPNMIYVNDDEFQVLEERAPGEPLTAERYKKLPKPHQYKICNSIGSFLVDMNELKPVGEPIHYNLSTELKISRLDKFIELKMDDFGFTKKEKEYLRRIRDMICSFEYTTISAMSHGDLNSGNVFYDEEQSLLSFIDFADSDYNVIDHDIFAPLHIELDICRPVYETYAKLHNKSLYAIPGVKNEILREVKKHRMLAISLKRFIRASDDLRINPKNEKSVQNNLSKVAFMRNQLAAMLNTQRLFAK